MNRLGAGPWRLAALTAGLGLLLPGCGTATNRDGSLDIPISTAEPAGHGGTRNCWEAGAPPAAIQDRHIGTASSPITLKFDAAVPAAMLGRVEEALAAAQNEFGGSGPLLVQLYCNDDFISASAGARGETEAEVRERLRLGEAATWSPGKVFIYLPQYAKGTPGRQRRTLFHEYFHSVQFFLADQALPEPEPPLWMVEGSASYFAWYGRSAAEAGEYEPYRKSQIDEARQYGPLESYERSGAGRSRGGLGQAYVLGFLASEYLVAQKGVSALKHDFWSGLSEWREPWPAVFARVFGDSPETFYRKFEAHRATLKP